jgi:hypothetical protein
MKIFTVSDGQDVALGERALGGHASEQAMDSIPQTRSERNPPLRCNQAKLLAAACRKSTHSTSGVRDSSPTPVEGRCTP